MREEYRPSRRRIFLSRSRSSCESGSSGPKSTEQLEKLAVDDGRLRQFIDACCTMDYVQGCLYTGSPSRQTIDGCVCNGLMSTEPGKLIDSKLSFQMNHASICEITMAAFVFDAMPVNTAFQSAYIREVLHRRRSLPSRHPWSSFNSLMHAHMLQRPFETAQHMQLLSWPSYSPDMAPIQHVLDLVGRDPRPTASKDEILLRIQTIWNSLP
ncbi:transposable element Tcb2 transposase [Trichonephila clavipes]|nr:transposable element Tcb2 transposase [Trichonephila clavipes]